MSNLCKYTAKYLLGNSLWGGVLGAILEFIHCLELLPLLLLRGGWCGVQVWRPLHELIDSYSSGIEQVLQYQFKKRGLLQEALTHTSWLNATQQASPLP